MKFENVYWDDASMKNDGVYPSILAIGDSWFWYPFPGGSLLNQLGRLVAKKEHFILALGNNGAEAYDYAIGKYNRSIRTALKFHGPSLSAVFISGGGNDFAGMNDLRPMLNDDCSRAHTAAECFRPGDEDRTLDWLMRKTGDSFRLLIGQIMTSANQNSRIILHNYDYAFPSGQGVFGKKGSWLRPALDDANVPKRLHRSCIQHVIDRLSDELHLQTDIDPSRIFLVDSRDTLREEDWANEIHPKPSGFKDIARNAWLPVLQNAGLAP